MNLIETERLIIRPWEEDDWRDWRTLCEDVGFICFAPPGLFAHLDEASTRQKMRDYHTRFQTTGMGKLATFDKKSGEIIGRCGIDPFEWRENLEMELGYRLRLKYWGQGLATEAAHALLRYGWERLQAKQLFAFALAQNRGSLKVIDKLGFKYVESFEHAGNPHRLYRISRPVL